MITCENGMCTCICNLVTMLYSRKKSIEEITIKKKKRIPPCFSKYFELQQILKFDRFFTNCVYKNQISVRRCYFQVTNRG